MGIRKNVSVKVKEAVASNEVTHVKYGIAK
jgi:hypothetical protein